MPRPINTATRIGQLRSILGLKAQEFAMLAGISQGMLKRVEGGFDPLSTRATERLAFAIGVDPAWLLGEGEEHRPTRLDVSSGVIVPLTRESFSARTEKNLTGPLSPSLDRIHREKALMLLACLRTTERFGTPGAAHYLADRLLADMINRLARSQEEAEAMRSIFASEHKAIR